MDPEACYPYEQLLLCNVARSASALYPLCQTVGAEYRD
jgi:hypothetical protein